MNRMMRTIERGKGIYRRLAEKKYTTISGTLAFFLIMSLLPFLFWLFLLFGKFHLRAEEILQLDIFVGVQDLLLFFQKSALAATNGVSFTLLLTTLYSSTNLFYHMRRSGEIIYASRRQKGGWRIRFSAFVLIFVMFLLVALATGVLLLGNRIFRLLLPAPLSEFSVYLLLFAIAFGIACLLNLYICPFRIRFKDGMVGSALSTLLWAIASFGFTIYLRFADPGKLYGAIAAVIVFFLWLYLMIVCFVVGVIYNESRIERKYLEYKKF